MIDELEGFVGDDQPDKRARLIDKLLHSNGYDSQVIQDFDIHAESQAAMTGLVREFEPMIKEGTLQVKLISTRGQSLNGGLELRLHVNGLPGELGQD